VYLINPSRSLIPKLVDLSASKVGIKLSKVNWVLDLKSVGNGITERPVFLNK